MVSVAAGASGASGLEPVEPTYRGVLKVREFRGLWLAELTSLLGDQLARLALAVLIFHRSHSPLLATLSYVVSYLPSLIIGPAAGLLTDILPRRRVLIVCDLARLALIAAMCIPGLSIAVLLLLLFAASAFEPPSSSARAALLPEVVPGEMYPVAQSLASVTDQNSQIAGFALGGVLIGLISARGALAIDAATFLVSALVVVFYVRDRPAAARLERGSYWRDNSVGARVIWRTPLLRDLVAVTCVGLGLVIATEGMAVPYANQLGVGSVGIGLLAAALPAGTVIGMVVVSKLVRPPSRLNAIRLLSVIWPLPLVATALKPPIALTILLWMCAGALTAYSLLANVAFTQALAPETRGRVFAVARALVIAAQGIGLLVTGFVADIFDPATAVALAGVAGVLVCPLFSSALRPAGRHRSLEPDSSRPANGREISMAVRSQHAPHDDVALAFTVIETASPDAPVHDGAENEIRRLRARTAVIYSASAIIIAATVAAVLGDLLPRATTSGSVHLSWYVLAAVVLITGIFEVPFQRGEHATTVSLSQLAIVLGLLASSPNDLVVATVLATTVVYLRSRPVPIRFAVTVAACALTPVVACVVFAALRHGHGLGWSSFAAAFVAAIAADIASLVFVVAMRRLVDPTLHRREIGLMFCYVAAAGMTASSLGLLTIAAMSSRPSFGWLLALAGLLIVVGSRSYVELQKRHQDLGELYSFKEKLGPLLPEMSMLAPVLRSTLDIINATTVELTIFAESDDDNPDSRRHVLVMSADGEIRETWQTSRVPDELDSERRISVPLRGSGGRLGTLTALDRRGNVRGFKRTDLRLLNTLAGQVADALQRGELIAQLQDAATHDSLTGLLTLSEFSRRIDEHLARNEPAVIALIDVARLKDVNDSLGHEAGDALLRTVGQRLGEFVPPNAYVARSGGGEFAVAVPGLQGFQAVDAIDRMGEGLTGLVEVLGVTIDLRTRIGWDVAPRDGQDAANLLRRADLALGLAKRGLQRSARFQPDIEVDGLRRLRLVSDLRVAIDNRDLTVVFQPLVTPKDGYIVGAEALVRWTHWELGPLGPDEFIVIAEQSGTIGDLTELVLDESLRQTSEWRNEGRDLGIAVNLSARCLSDLALPGMVLDLLAKYRLDPSCLTLEVTETSVAEDPERAEVVLDRLRGIGVRLSIDDFGTGYSSLASLKRFPVHEVKLDRQFLVEFEAALSADSAPNSESTMADVAMLTAVVALGHTLNLEIVAEGVETEAAYRRLRDLGIDVLQGYYMGRPDAGNRLPWRFTPGEAGGPPSVEMWEPPDSVPPKETRKSRSGR